MPSPCEPPCSFSIREGDENFCPAWRVIGRSFDVFINGKRATRVIAYDCDEGWVRFFSEDELGVIAIEDGYPIEATSHGRVEARWIVKA